MERSLWNGDLSKPRVKTVIPDFRPLVQPSSAVDSLLAQLPSVPYILFVGALRRVKGVHVLFQAYAALPSSRPPLVLIGSMAPDTPNVGPGVTVLHDWPFAAVLEAWKRCLFGVSPSVWPEPLGNVVHEGMSEGKAIIGTTPGGHESMITDGVNGLLVPSGSVEHLRAAMLRLIEDVPFRESLEN